MNREPSYEKLIAEKLQDLPLPDMEQSWQQMKLLLDKDMPESGAVPPPPRGRGGWWIAGSVLSILAIIMGTWFFYPASQNDAEKNTVASSSSGEKHTGAASTGAVAGQNEGNTTKAAVKTNPQEDAEQPLLAAKLSTKNNASAKNIHELNSAPTNENSKPTNGSPIINNDENIEVSNPVKTNSEADAALKPQPLTGLKNVTTNNTSDEEAQQKSSVTNNSQQEVLAGNINSAAAGSDEKNQPVSDAQNPPTPTAVPNQTSLATHEGSVVYDSIQDLTMETAGATGEKTFSYQLASVPRENYLYSNRHSLTGLPDSSSLTEVEVPASVWQLPDVEKQRKAILKQMKKEERRNERELAKSYRSNRTFWGASTDRWFAAGIAPYQSLAVGSQQAYGYNSGGTRGIATDYIPAPYLQLHITDRVYVLSEFQFHTPQATPNLLLSQRTNTSAQAPWNVENTYLRKMYYFNMPLSFYYSPFKNVYLGSGLQFSSFNSGLAYREQRGANNSIVQSEVLKIREDSLSSLISSSEWRYLVDANYYVDRFMFGLRYNQALNNFVNLKSIANMPASQARNQAFQLYIRYNLVVTKRKK